MPYLAANLLDVLEIYQFIAPAIALYYIYRIIKNVKSGRRFVFSSLMWLAFWILITLLSIMPHDFSMGLARMLGFKDNVNTIIFIALAFLIVLSFYLSSRLERMEKDLTELVRQTAINNELFNNRNK